LHIPSKSRFDSGFAERANNLWREDKQLSRRVRTWQAKGQPPSPVLDGRRLLLEMNDVIQKSTLWKSQCLLDHLLEVISVPAVCVDPVGEADQTCPRFGRIVTASLQYLHGHSLAILKRPHF
jgi:hypothetical protein